MISVRRVRHAVHQCPRFFGENLAADFSLLALVGEDTSGFPFVPWIGFAYNFGKK